MARRAAAALVVAVALVALPACERQVSGPSLVLRLASPEPATQDTGPPIEWFAAEVDRRSGGTIRIEPVWDVAVAGTTGFDQFTAGKVVDGVPTSWGWSPAVPGTSSVWRAYGRSTRRSC